MAEETKVVDVGDWVRYLCTHRQAMVIDVVQYFKVDDFYPRKRRAFCINGSVPVDDILEVRSAKPENPS